MKRTIIVSASAAGVALAATMLVSPGATQQSSAEQQSSPNYNPYPDGILPPDLLPEVNRVRREVRGIFEKYLQQWQALPPPTVAGNPPTLRGSGEDAIRILGGLLNYDQNMSPFKNEACASCHMPYAVCRMPALAVRSPPSISQ